MKKNGSILKIGLVVATIILIIFVIVCNISNKEQQRYSLMDHQKSSPAISKNSIIVSENLPYHFLQFEEKPYTEGIQNIAEKSKSSATKILQTPRNLSVEGHPFNGNSKYDSLQNPIVMVDGVITQTPFDYSQSFNLAVLLAEEKNYWRSGYEPYHLNDEKYSEEMENCTLCFTLKVSELFQNALFEFSPCNLVLLDSDGITPLPYWIQDDYHREALVWVRLPEFNVNGKKTLFIGVNENNDYPVLDKNYAFSNFDSVFLKNNSFVTGQYQFRLNKIGTYKEVLDLSGNDNNGVVSAFGWGEYDSATSGNSRNEYAKINFCATFREEKAVNLKINNENSKVLSKEKGSAEIIIDSRIGYFTRFDHYFSFTNPDDGKTDYLKKFYLDDTNQEFRFYYCKEAFHLEFEKNSLPMEAIIPLSEELLSDQSPLIHFFCTWDQANNKLDFYINGKKQNDVTFVQMKNKTPLEIGDIVIGNSVNGENKSSSFIPSVYFYNESFSPIEVSELMSKHWHEQNPMVYATMESSKSDCVNDAPDFNEIVLGDNLYYDLMYASPVNGDYYGNQYDIANVKGRLVNALYSAKEDWQPIFGVPTHFYSYVGTGIIVKNSCLVEYVKLKINDPSLIEELKIDFSYLSGTNFSQNERENKSAFAKLLTETWNKIVRPAMACGPFYSYIKYGSSELQLVSSDGDSYIYKLEKPVYIDEIADFMQIYFKSTSKNGLLSIALEDLYVSSDGMYSKAVYAPDQEMKPEYHWEKKWNEDKKTFDLEFTDWDGSMEIYPDFQVVIAGEEHGLSFVEVLNNGEELALVFKNIGINNIVITEDSLASIQATSVNRKWDGFKIVPIDENGKRNDDYAVYQNISKLINTMIGKVIEPGGAISIKFFNLKKYKRKKGFRDAIGLAIFKRIIPGQETRETLVSLKDAKIIQWDERLRETDSYGVWSYNEYLNVGITEDRKLEILGFENFKK